MNIFKFEKTEKYYLFYFFNIKLSFSNRKSYFKERLCFLAKIQGLFNKNKKYYDHIIPLGRNCEFGINAHKYHHKFESSLLLWTSCGNVKNVIRFLKQPDDLFSEGCSFSEEEIGWHCKKLLFGFHSKHKPKYFFQNNILDKQKVEEDRLEIESRVKYLKEKFLKQVQSSAKKLFVITFDIEHQQEPVELLNELYKTLNEISTNFDLLIVIEKPYYIDSIKIFEEKYENIYIRTLEKFSDTATANKPLDALGWTYIFNEFKPKFKPKKKRKKLKYES